MIFVKGKKKYNWTHGFVVFILAVVTVKWLTPFKIMPKCAVMCSWLLHINLQLKMQRVIYCHGIE